MEEKSFVKDAEVKDKKLEATCVRFVKSSLNRVNIGCDKSKRNESVCVSCLI